MFESPLENLPDEMILKILGYVKIQDRSKDIIISGGENISTIEIENVLFVNALLPTTYIPSIYIYSIYLIIICVSKYELA